MGEGTVVFSPQRTGEAEVSQRGILYSVFAPLRLCVKYQRREIFNREDAKARGNARSCAVFRRVHCVFFKRKRNCILRKEPGRFFLQCAEKWLFLIVSNDTIT